MGEGERRPYVEAEAYGTAGLSDALVMQRQERRINELEGELKRLKRRLEVLETAVDLIKTIADRSG